MRDDTNAQKVIQFMEQMGRRTKGPCRIYLTGGASAVLEGWRPTTSDIDIHFSPEPRGAFEAIAEIKRSLNINVELAKPSDFIPELPNWESRSSFIDQKREVQFFHYDFASQALAKIERGHEKDLLDVKEMVRGGLVKASVLLELFERIEAKLIRFPAIDPEAFRQRVELLVEELSNEP